MPVPPSLSTTHKLQRALGRLGRYTGPIDDTLEPGLTEAIQTHLNHEGVYSGAISGTYSVATANAVQRYLRERGLYGGAIDGALTEPLWLSYLQSIREINQSIDDPAVDLPTFTNSVLPAITGTAKVATTLTVSNGTWGSVTPDSYRYQWFKAGAPIVGATNNTYAPVAGDVGAVLSATVTAIEESYANASATSAPTAAVIP